MHRLFTYVFLKMCIFEVTHFTFETSKTVERKKERKKKIIDYDENQNLFLT